MADVAGMVRVSIVFLVQGGEGLYMEILIVLYICFFGIIQKSINLISSEMHSPKRLS
jgi:hypothetical protein